MLKSSDAWRFWYVNQEQWKVVLCALETLEFVGLFDTFEGLFRRLLRLVWKSNWLEVLLTLNFNSKGWWTFVKQINFKYSLSCGVAQKFQFSVVFLELNAVVGFENSVDKPLSVEHIFFQFRCAANLWTPDCSVKHLFSRKCVENRTFSTLNKVGSVDL